MEHLGYSILIDLFELSERVTNPSRLSGRIVAAQGPQDRRSVIRSDLAGAPNGDRDPPMKKSL